MKATVAPRDAPSRRSEIAVGITPHEHKGSGMPNNVAHNTDLKFSFARCFSKKPVGTKTCRIPAIRKPNRRYGAIWQSMLMNVWRIFMVKSFYVLRTFFGFAVFALRRFCASRVLGFAVLSFRARRGFFSKWTVRTARITVLVRFTAFTFISATASAAAFLNFLYHDFDKENYCNYNYK